MAETRITALGGLNEIGLNALAIEAAEGVVLVDCGLLVDAQSPLGIDYWIPDFTYLADRRDRLLGVLLTHGHEDHIGAVPHLLRDFPVPVYGTRFTLELLDSRLKEFCPNRRKLLLPVEPGATVPLGPFRAEFLRVPHSVPDACAVAVSTPGGNVFCTGDFKLDPTPVDGHPADEGSLARWRDRGIDLLCCDSTNAAVSGKTPSERAVGETLRTLFPEVRGRIYFSTFSSHIHRIQQVVEASREVGRAVTFLSRSLAENVRSARRLGILRVAPGDIVPVARASALPRDRLTVVLAGAQGEAGSALRRVVGGELPRHRLLPGDEVFLSSRVIPGYERSVGGLINRCLEQGARVHAGRESGIHASGHPCAGDVLRLFDLAAPAHVLPVHGERRHREALAALARRWGLPDERVLLASNGKSLLLRDGRAFPGPEEPFGRAFVEGGLDGPAHDPLLKDRGRLGRRGVALAVVCVSPEGRVVWGPRVTLRGVFPSSVEGAHAREAEGALRAHLGAAGARGARGARLEAELEAVLRRFFRKHLSGPPLTVIQLLEPQDAVGLASAPH